MQIFPFSGFFLRFCLKTTYLFRFFALFAFFVITFEPTKCYAPQNDRLNLSIVKYFYLVGKKMAKNGLKTAISQLQILEISL